MIQLLPDEANYYEEVLGSENESTLPAILPIYDFCYSVYAT